MQFEQAWQQGVKSKEPYLAIDAAQMVAMTLLPAEQRLWHQLGMELAELSPD